MARRAQLLQGSLKGTVQTLDIEDLDKQLARHAPKRACLCLPLMDCVVSWCSQSLWFIGTEGIEVAFGIIREIVRGAIVSEDPVQLTVKNAARRDVLVQVAADPDIKIQEVMRSGVLRHLIAIEVKSGRDFSNIRNRVGEAEKSHRKARAGGFTECWTIVNVDRTGFDTAKRESPSTDRFYRLSDLSDQSSESYLDFRDRIQALTGT
jgi:hypothetical protein